MRAEADRVVLRAVLDFFRAKKPHWPIPIDAVNAARSEDSRLAVYPPLRKGRVKLSHNHFPKGPDTQARTGKKPSSWRPDADTCM